MPNNPLSNSAVNSLSNPAVNPLPDPAVNSSLDSAVEGGFDERSLISFEDITRDSVKAEMSDPIEISGIEEENHGRPWNLISAFDCVLENIRNIGHEPSQWFNCIHAAQYLKSILGMNEIQIMAIAMLMDAGKSMSWGMMARFLNISRLKMMTYTDDVEELVSKFKWVYHKGVNELGNRFEGYALEKGVIAAIRHNQVYVPEKLDGLTEQLFVDRMVSKIHAAESERDSIFSDTEQWLMNLVSENPHLPLCHDILQLQGDIHVKSLLLMVVADYAQFAGRWNEGLELKDIDDLYPEDWECGMMRQKLMDGQHELQQKGYIDFKCEDGMADGSTFVLTDKTKNELLSAYRPYHAQKVKGQRGKDPDLVDYKDIAPKALFYNAAEEHQVARMHQLFAQEEFLKVQERLAAKGLRRGVAVLLSGGPGTGKTETVKQLALATHRDLLTIDISTIKSKWVGDSEKNVRAIFSRYKRLCQESEVMPILFINECDAILGKRMENAEQSVDKMNNTMQNILLQALEDLEGIMICTTNLAKSLDKAFERRFLLKVEFNKPGIEVRSHIWQSMIPQLSDSDARILGERYDFSGGQCENIMRKAAIDEILNDIAPSLDTLDTLCQEECTSKDNNRVIGFGQ